MHLAQPKPVAVGLCLTLACLTTILVPCPVQAQPEQISAAERIAVSMVAAYLDGGASALWPRLAPGSGLHSMGQEAAELELSARMGTTSGSRWTLAHLDHGGGRNAIFHVEYPSGIDDLFLFEIDLSTERLQSLTTLAEAGGSSGSWRMAPLANLRHVLTRGDVLFGSDDSRSVESLLRVGEASRTPTGQAGFEASVRRLWLAQYRLLRADGEGALRALGEGEGSGAPLEILLRARIAIVQDDTTGGEKHFRDLLDQFDADVLRQELAHALIDADDWTSAQEELQRLAGSGSRLADAHYLLSRLSLFSRLGQAEPAFRAAWKLEPMERAKVLEDPYFAFLLGRADLYDILHLGDAAEPVLGPSPNLRKDIGWPTAAAISISGDYLQAWVGKALLVVPGGALLAPPSVRPSTARDLRREREARALKMVPRLKSSMANPSLLDSPALLRDMEQAAQALANAAEESAAGSRKEAWNQLVQLTEVVQKVPKPPASLATLRVSGLWQIGRKQEAIDLLVKLASDSGLMGQDPSVVFELSRLCAEEGRADLAVRLLRRLRGIENFAGLRRHIERYELDQRLDGDFESYKTVHFDLRHDASLDFADAVILGGYLESELERLQEWIPIQKDGGERIEVHLVPAADFYRVYGGGVGILGLFDGRIRLPVFDLGKQSTVMTGVLSHELAHAMIDRATHDCAPKWFHEGLAQLVEPGSRQTNPYRSGVKAITMPLVESVLRGFSETRLVALAYEEAYWTLRFVEKSEGLAGIHGLLKAFGECRQTPDALRQAFGKSAEDFDGELQAWAKGPDAPLEDKGLRLAFSESQLDHMEEMAPGFADAIERKKAEGSRPMPKVGLVKELPTKKDIEDQVVDAVIEVMVEWHAQYQRFATLIKQELAKVLAGMRGGSMPPQELQKACNGLWTLTVSIQMGELETIDKDVTRSLRGAYAAIGQAAGACVRGRDLGPALEKAEKQLGEAAYHLDKYGLKP